MHQAPQYNRQHYDSGAYHMNQNAAPPHMNQYYNPPTQQNYYDYSQQYQPMGAPPHHTPQGYASAPQQMYRGAARGRGGNFAMGESRGYRGRGAYRGAFRGARGRGQPFMRHRRQFVGGSLETQREWEGKTACCFFRDGNCMFGATCRFLHEDGEGRPCQFGVKCRKHGEENAKLEPETKSDHDAKPTPSEEQNTAADVEATEAAPAAGGEDNQ